jgi:GntR family transcriptional repressor for pyruvate dehydrogenase complex
MSHSFDPVGKRELLSKSVEAQIEAAIRARIFVPGARLPAEFEMCRQFGVSRTAIREALRMLSARGLVIVEKGRGVFVNRLTAESVTNPMELYLSMNQSNFALDVVHARQIIEPPIAAAAALHRSQEDLELLASNIEELEEGDDDDHALLTALDMEFHLGIARATKNTVVPLILEPIHQLMPSIKKAVYDEISDARAAAIEWHGRILEEIVRGDADAAFEAMTRHLKIAEHHVKLATHLD